MGPGVGGETVLFRGVCSLSLLQLFRNMGKVMIPVFEFLGVWWGEEK